MEMNNTALTKIVGNIRVIDAGITERFLPENCLFSLKQFERVRQFEVFETSIQQITDLKSLIAIGR